VLNDNGRSYAPTISNVTSPKNLNTAPSALDETGELPRPQDKITKLLSRALTDIRLNPAGSNNALPGTDKPKIP